MMVWRFFFPTSRERPKKERKRGPKNVDPQAVNTIEETAKTIFERLYLVLDRTNLWTWSPFPMHPHPPPLSVSYFSIFLPFQFSLGPRGSVEFFYRHTSWVGWDLEKSLFLQENFCTADPFPGTKFRQLWRKFFWREINRDLGSIGG